MRRSLSVVILFLAVLPAWADPPSVPAPKAVSFVRVNTDTGQGSGVVVGTFPCGKVAVLTNHHVIKGTKEYLSVSWEIPDPCGECYTTVSVRCEVAGSHEGSDVAVLIVHSKAHPFQPVPLADKVPKVGAKVRCTSSPMGLTNTVSSGSVTFAGRYSHGTTWDQVDAPIQSGSSGGAVCDAESGVCYGIVQSTTGGNIAWVIPARRIRPMLASLNLKEYSGK